MPKPEAGPMSGFRDQLAEQMIPRQEMIDTIRGVYERYGFVPLETPALERLETLQGKLGEEADKLMYKFKDQGGRDVALRYDLTVPLARVAAQHRAEIPMPYKRYQVGPVWRGESPQAGRYREFLQFDADTVGTKSPIADAEIVAMMSDSMTALGAEATVRVNNRRFLDALVEKAGVEEKDQRYFIATIDKLGKIGQDNVLLTVNDIGGEKARKAVEEYLGISGTSRERIAKLRDVLGNSQAANEGAENLEAVFSYLETAGYDQESIVFDQTIARGLDYYTGIIYETTLNDLPGIGSVCSGGRYDNLVKDLGGPDLPAVGTSIGVDRLFEGLKQLGKLETHKTQTQVLVANFGENNGAYMKLATELRRAGVATEVYYDSAKIGKQISFADKLGVPYITFLGEEEISVGVITVRNMETREQIKVSINQLIDLLKK